VEVHGQLLTPAALHLEKEHMLSIRKEAGWAPRVGMDTIKKRRFALVRNLLLSYLV